MTIDLLKNIFMERPKNERLLGLDVGQKTIGLALSNPDHTIATPLKTIKRTKFTKDMQALQEVIADYEIRGFIIGLPINMSGSEGRRAQSVRDFAAEMAHYMISSSCGLTTGSESQQEDPAIKLQDGGHGIWIALWDERLSTVSADNIVDNLVEKRKTKINAKASGLIDKLAAHHILQGALDFIQAADLN